MACEAQKFGNITREKFQEMTGKAAAEFGVRIDSDSGSATMAGFTLTWSYGEITQELVLQCTGKPFIVPCSIVQEKIAQLVETI